jgi:hypothetical protein
MRAVVLWLALLSSVPVVGCNSIADSHLAANVPAEQDFDSFMKRDLQAYFSARLGRTVEVQYSLLRLGATQTGIAYPKYYVWAIVESDGAAQLEGAARVAAVDQARFDVTDFVPKAEILLHPEAIQSIFPAPVCDEIKKRL